MLAVVIFFFSFFNFFFIFKLCYFNKRNVKRKKYARTTCQIKSFNASNATAEWYIRSLKYSRLQKIQKYPDLVKLRDVFVQAHVQNLGQVGRSIDRKSNSVGHVLPMTLPETRIAKGTDHRHLALELLNLFPDVDDKLSGSRDVAELVLQMRDQLPGAVHLLIDVLRIMGAHRTLKPVWKAVLGK